MWCWLGIGKDNTTFDETDAPIFRNVALITIGIGGLCSLLFHIIIKFEPLPAINEGSESSYPEIGILEGDRDSTHRVAQNRDNNESIPLISSEKYDVIQPMSNLDWLRELQLYHVACLYLFSRLFVNVSQAYIPLFLNITLRLPATFVAIVPMVMYVSGIFMAIAIKFISMRWGIKMASIISCVVGGGGCLWTYWGMYLRHILLFSYILLEDYAKIC